MHKRKRQHHASSRHERSLEQLVLRDGNHRLTVKGAETFRDPEIVRMLHQVADARLPRLFGRTGTWHDEHSPLLWLPSIPPSEIGLDRYPHAAGQPLLVLEYVEGSLLSETDRFSASEAGALYLTYTMLADRLARIMKSPVRHFDIRPDRCIRTPEGGFCFIDWQYARIGPYAPEQDQMQLAQTIVSLLQEKPMHALNRLDRILAFGRLPLWLRTQLRDVLRNQRTRSVKS